MNANDEDVPDLPEEVIEELVGLMEWTRVDISAEQYADSDIAVLETKCPHTLAGYASADGSHKELVWDTSEHRAAAIPLFIKHPETGERLLLSSYSRKPVRHYPLRIGDRVFAELSDVRAHHFAREWFERHETDPRWLEAIKSKFNSRDEALAACIDRLRRMQMLDVVRVTSAMLAELVESGVATDGAAVAEAGAVVASELTSGPAVRSLLKAAGIETDYVPGEEHSISSVGPAGAGLPPDIRDKFEQLVARLVALIWPETASSNTVIAVDVSYLDVSGNQVSSAEWHKLQCDHAYCVQRALTIESSTVPVRMELTWGWVGLDIRRRDTGQRQTVLAAHMKRYRTNNPNGETPWQIREFFATMADLAVHHDAVKELASEPHWLAEWDVTAKEFHEKIAKGVARGHSVVPTSGQSIRPDQSRTQRRRDDLTSRVIDNLNAELMRHRKQKDRGKA